MFNPIKAAYKAWSWITGLIQRFLSWLSSKNPPPNPKSSGKPAPKGSSDGLSQNNSRPPSQPSPIPDNMPQPPSTSEVFNSDQIPQGDLQSSPRSNTDNNNNISQPPSMPTSPKLAQSAVSSNPLPKNSSQPPSSSPSSKTSEVRKDSRSSSPKSNIENNNASKTSSISRPSMTNRTSVPSETLPKKTLLPPPQDPNSANLAASYRSTNIPVNPIDSSKFQKKGSLNASPPSSSFNARNIPSHESNQNSNKNTFFEDQNNFQTFQTVKAELIERKNLGKESENLSKLRQEVEKTEKNIFEIKNSYLSLLEKQKGEEKEIYFHYEEEDDNIKKERSYLILTYVMLQTIYDYFRERPADEHQELTTLISNLSNFNNTYEPRKIDNEEKILHFIETIKQKINSKNLLTKIDEIFNNDIKKMRNLVIDKRRVREQIILRELYNEADFLTRNKPEHPTQLSANELETYAQETWGEYQKYKDSKKNRFEVYNSLKHEINKIKKNITKIDQDDAPNKYHNIACMSLVILILQMACDYFEEKNTLAGDKEKNNIKEILFSSLDNLDISKNPNLFQSVISFVELIKASKFSHKLESINIDKLKTTKFSTEVDRLWLEYLMSMVENSTNDLAFYKDLIEQLSFTDAEAEKYENRKDILNVLTFVTAFSYLNQISDRYDDKPPAPKSPEDENSVTPYRQSPIDLIKINLTLYKTLLLILIEKAISKNNVDFISKENMDSKNYFDFFYDQDVKTLISSFINEIKYYNLEDMEDRKNCQLKWLESSLNILNELHTPFRFSDLTQDTKTFFKASETLFNQDYSKNLISAITEVNDLLQTTIESALKAPLKISHLFPPKETTYKLN